MEKENVLGVNVCITDYGNLKNSLHNDLASKKKVFLVAINPEKILKARKDSGLLNLLNSATYPIPDGIGVIYASKLRGGKIRTRITGIDSMTMLCELAAENGLRVFLYGAKEETVEVAAKKLVEMYPGINVAGYINGYEKDKQKITKMINDSKADILFVAMGSPRQENWIVDNMDDVCPYLFQGVGGSFDVISGNIKRAPIWMQKCGLEWLYRLIREPSRIGRQIKLFGFLWLALFNK